MPGHSLTPPFVLSASQHDRAAQMDEAWHLAEVLYVRSEVLVANGGYVIMDLLEWVAQHYAQADHDVTAIAHMAGNYESHDRYWPAIFLLVCQGRTQEARELLRLHRHFPRGACLWG